MLGGLLGIVLQQCHFAHSTSVGYISLVLEGLLATLCSLGVLSGYVLGHRITEVPWAELIPMRRCGIVKRMVAILFVAFGLAFLVTVVNFGVTHGGSEANPQYLVQYIQEAGWLRRLWLLMLVCVFAPTCEELLFRLALPRWLKARGLDENLADVASSFVFAFAHLLWWGIPGFFLFGIVLCYLRRRQDILSCCCVHALYNLLVAVVTISLGS